MRNTYLAKKITAWNDWLNVGKPQVAMYSQFYGSTEGSGEGEAGGAIIPLTSGIFQS